MITTTKWVNATYMSAVLSEMRGYQFLISAFYPYPLKTIRILFQSVQTLLTAIRILTESVVLIMARCHRESPTLFVTGVPI